MNAELIAKAKTAKNPEELLALARENGMELTKEEAAAFFAKLNPPAGELSDEELDNVAGGGCKGHTEMCPNCGGRLRANGNSDKSYSQICDTCGYVVLQITLIQ